MKNNSGCKYANIELAVLVETQEESAKLVKALKDNDFTVTGYKVTPVKNDRYLAYHLLGITLFPNNTKDLAESIDLPEPEEDLEANEAVEDTSDPSSVEVIGVKSDKSETVDEDVSNDLTEDLILEEDSADD